MFVLDMSKEVDLLSEGQATPLTLVTAHVTMNIHVSLQVTACGRSVLAHIARIWFHICKSIKFSVLVHIKS